MGNGRYIYKFDIKNLNLVDKVKGDVILKYDSDSKEISKLFKLGSNNGLHSNQIVVLKNGNFVVNTNSSIKQYDIKGNFIKEVTVKTWSIGAMKYSSYYDKIFIISNWGDLVIFNPQTLESVSHNEIKNINGQCFDFAINDKGELYILTSYDLLYKVTGQDIYSLKNGALLFGN